MFGTFALNFIVAYFIYDDPSILKPFVHSVLILALIVLVDLFKKKQRATR
ncbi:hypothetical protein BAG01nite_48650 [Brevibacillus agri]|uniref:Uncharacterized protein n=1 Tax=Brevibacillus agri TaxID=51101 RepID=A0ABQ0SYC7_9BACL|nr:hypothetical protein BAG01nite_48650 [Brevibacillus agri]